MIVTIRGVRWVIKYCGRLRNNWGLCDHEKKVISISKKAKGLVELDTILHECLHAAFPDLNEEAVNTTSSDIAKILRDMGFEKR